MSRTGKPEDRHARVKEFVQAHSGGRRQCRRHGVIAELTWREIGDALQQHTGLTYTRQWLKEMFDELGVETRARRGPPPKGTPEERRARRAEAARRRYRERKRT